MVLVKELVTEFERFAPKELAMPKDPVGLQLGFLEQEVTKMMVTLDVRPETVAEAITNGCDFIFAHHPAVFRPIQPFDLAQPQNQMYAEILKHNITVYAAHTNLDCAAGGMNDWLAMALDLQAVKPLREDGLGRIGNLATEMTVADFAAYCKQVFKLQGLRVISADLNAKVKRVAVLGGAGGSFYEAALAQGAEAYVTGDISYHTGHDVLAAGLNVFDVGHHVESICKPHLKSLFEQIIRQKGWNLPVIESKLNTDPFIFC